MHQLAGESVEAHSSSSWYLLITVIVSSIEEYDTVLDKTTDIRHCQNNEDTKMSNKKDKYSL